MLLRTRIAWTISSTPVTIAQAAMNISSVTAATPGAKNVMSPAAMPSTPISTSGQIGLPPSRAL